MLRKLELGLIVSFIVIVILYAYLVLASGNPIDIGSEAIDRSGSFVSGITLIDMTNPANDSGIINTIEIYANIALSNVKVGTFSGSSGTFVNRDYALIESVSARSKQTFPELSIDVETGDYLGIYYETGEIDYGSGGSGVKYKWDDQFGQGSQSGYATISGSSISVYGIGITEDENSCTCPGSGENWEIDLSDNCVISDSCDLGTGNITFTGTGNITFDAIITAFSIGELPANQRGFLTSSAEVNVG